MNGFKIELPYRLCIDVQGLKFQKTSTGFCYCHWVPSSSTVFLSVTICHLQSIADDIYEKKKKTKVSYLAATKDTAHHLQDKIDELLSFQVFSVITGMILPMCFIVK